MFSPRNLPLTIAIVLKPLKTSDSQKYVSDLFASDYKNQITRNYSRLERLFILDLCKVSTNKVLLSVSNVELENQL